MQPIPRVVEGILSVPGWSAGAITVGSPAWISWLTDPPTRSFSFRAPGGTPREGTLVVRLENGFATGNLLHDRLG
jgi:hypothetical protein